MYMRGGEVCIRESGPTMGFPLVYQLAIVLGCITLFAIGGMAVALSEHHGSLRSCFSAITSKAEMYEQLQDSV